MIAIVDWRNTGISALYSDLCATTVCNDCQLQMDLEIFQVNHHIKKEHLVPTHPLTRSGKNQFGGGVSLT